MARRTDEAPARRADEELEPYLWRYALRSVARRDMPQRALEQKLKRAATRFLEKRTPPIALDAARWAVIFEALCVRLSAARLLDDMRYGRRRAASLLRRGDSPARCAFLLRAEGVDEVESILESIEIEVFHEQHGDESIFADAELIPDPIIEDLTSLAGYCLARRQSIAAKIGRGEKERARVQRGFLRRGYDFALAKQLIENPEPPEDFEVLYDRLQRIG